MPKGGLFRVWTIVFDGARVIPTITNDGLADL
jgi:hypothetical protein